MESPEYLSEHIKFTHEFSGNAAAIEVTGFVISRPHNFDPVGKIWGSVKRRIFDQYGISVTGCFLYSDSHRTVSGRFYLDNAKGEGTVESRERIFEETFDHQAELFEAALRAFLADGEFGYNTYESLVAANSRAPSCDRASEVRAYRDLLNQFLVAHELRTKQDERESRKKKRLLKQVNDANARAGAPEVDQIQSLVEQVNKHVDHVTVFTVSMMLPM